MSQSPITQVESAGLPRRYTLVGLCFAGTFICYMDRVNISVAIIPMAEEFAWDASTQGLVLSAFFIGYLVTQILGGWLSDRFGGKAVLGAGVVLWSVFTLLTPPAAALGIGALILARIAMGVGEGVTFPSIYSLFGRWLPSHERSRAIGINASGIPLGSVFALLATPWIVINWGWPWAFYSFGAVGLVWWVFWQRSTARHPDEHPTITEAERALIRGADAESLATSTPWRSILRAPAVWAIIVCHFCNNWGGYVLLSWMPTYVIQGLGVDYAAVGLYTMIPALASFVFLNVAGWLGDRLITNGANTTAVRKWMQSIGFGGVAGALLLVGQVTDAVTAIAVMTVGNSLGAFAMAGFGVNHLDIAPRYAGVLMGLSNTAGTIPGIIGVYASGLILAATGSWALVFQVAAGIYIFGLVFYITFASGKRLFD